ncbi:MAG TPA: SagB/ThcOx family dehydrogenase [Paucimonas sp.]|nr:SagB/ThcOx family dehydrogenase [Paucimonas sp.]
MPKILWVLLPLTVYALYVAVATWRGRAPSRFSLNVQSSLFLVAYLLTTAGLGIFWVANQQLPVFDWHYLFGYATLLLVTVHLIFNLPVVLRWFKRTPAQRPVPDARGGMLTIGKVAALLGALGLAFYFGTRQGTNEPPLRWVQAGGETGRDGGRQTDAIDAIAAYHEFSSESQSSVFKRAPGVDWGTPPSDFKTYPDAPHIALARGPAAERGLSDALRAPAPRMQRLRLAELGEMLYLASGVTGPRGSNKRAAPSSGALFPSELYVAARAVEGLAPGMYHYDPEHDRLDALGPLPPDFGAPQAADADAAIILSAIFRRTGYKYRDRAYRYAVADAGHLLENLRIAGHQVGMQARLVPHFDEALAARAIGVDGVEEGVLAIMDVRGAAAPSSYGAPEAERYVMPAAPADDAIGVTGMVHRMTSLRLAPETQARPDAAGTISGAVSGAASGPIVALPPPAPSAAGVHRTITQRRSQRRFLADPVPLAALSSMLADMALPAQLSSAIRINLVVNRAEGLAPGVYRYLPRHALLRVREGDFAQSARSAALEQDVIGDAAVVLVLSADRERMLAPGPRGYRHGFLEAGMIGERWLLGAVARGLAACPVGAFYDDEAAALIGVDPRREWVLHFAALGWSAEK